MLFEMYRPYASRLLLFAPLLIISLMFTSCSMFNPTVNPGEVIFQDDFSREDSGWDRYLDDDYNADYIDGTYVIKVLSTNVTAWSRPHLDLENVLIRVEGLHRSGSENNVYGVICRYIDYENFYFFMIGSDGYAGIGKFIGGEKELLSHETLLPTDAIGPIDEVNLIQAACVDDDLTLWINGKQIFKVAASDLSHGDVGLLVGAYDEGNVEIQFDNFSTMMP
jgi:hypothetical protein